MTIEITEFTCPSCGHLIGEEEYKNICEKHSKQIIEKAEEISRQVHEVEIQYKKLIREKELNKETEIQRRVEEILPKERVAMESAHRKDQAEKDRRHGEELAEKDRQLQTARIQNTESIRHAVSDNEAKHELKDKQKEKEFQIQFDRIKARNEELQKTVDNIPPELKGTAGEYVLLDELKSSFPNDEIQSKKPGKEMADIVQTIVTDTGEKVLTPIVYDIKTGDSVTPADIQKAKRYKDIHNTDCSIIVTMKGIRPKDCESKHTSLIGKREGILLLHPSVVVGISRLIRNFIIETAKQARTNNVSESKYKKVYDYITSPERFRKMREKIQIKSNLDELQTNEEEYHRRNWQKRKKAIQDWFDSDKGDQEKIEDIAQEDVDTGDDTQNT